MDEPTASLSAQETERLFDVIRSLRSQGLAIIYISHRMDEVYALADRVSVLRDGVHVGVLDRSELSAEVLIRMMVGRDVTSFYTKNHVNRSERTLLSVCDLGDGSFIRECSFDLREGEVLGLAGLVGAGRTELARLIYGADPRSEGSMALEGRPFSPGEPMEAIEAGSRLPHRGSQRAWALSRHERRRERQPRRAFAQLAARPSRSGRHSRTRQKGNAIAGHSLPRRECERRYALWRKPAEGPDIPPPRNESQGVDPRRAHPRSGRRRQVGNLSPDR